jgi:hypothetical protein
MLGVVGIERQRQLLQVIAAGGLPGGLARGLHGRQQECGEHADNCDDDEQLDERKGAESS